MPKRKPSRCPSCDAERVARILYGLPIPDRKLRRQLASGAVVLGGCVIVTGDPVWECTACGHRWGGGPPSAWRPDGS